MPKVSREAKAASHARIIEVAAQQFREKGIGSTGLADIMSAAGMTHGGFYRHFGSKEELAAAAIAEGFRETLARLDAAEARTGGGGVALRDFVDQYLSDEHIDHPGHGCPIVALGAEAARGPEAERRAIADGIETTLERFSGLIGGDPEAARDTAMAVLTLMVGAVTVLRAMPAPEMQAGLRATVRGLIEARLA